LSFPYLVTIVHFFQQLSMFCSPVFSMFFGHGLCTCVAASSGPSSTSPGEIHHGEMGRCAWCICTSYCEIGNNIWHSVNTWESVIKCINIRKIHIILKCPLKEYGM
jgi:hypothetical protein